MKSLFYFADEYLRQSSWKDMALLKICLGSMGVILGCLVPKRHKKGVIFGSLALFVATYIPLVGKFISVIIKTVRNGGAEYGT